MPASVSASSTEPLVIVNSEPPVSADGVPYDFVGNGRMTGSLRQPSPLRLVVGRECGKRTARDLRPAANPRGSGRGH